MTFRPVTIEDTRVVTHGETWGERVRRRAVIGNVTPYAEELRAVMAEKAELQSRLATAEAERDRLLRQIARVRACPCISGASCDELDTLYDLAASSAPSTGTTPP